MTKRELFRELLRAKRDPARIGDMAVLKSELLGYRARPDLDAKLRAMAEPCPEVDLDGLGHLPRGTLGREYAELLAANRLSPFRLTAALDPGVRERQVFTSRYLLLHDVFHVLTGFDTSWAGEIGVWSFVAAQRYAPMHRIAVVLASLLYPLFAPLQIARIWRNRRLGREMGRAAASLIEVPLETMWDRPVDEIRRELGIVPARELDGTVTSTKRGSASILLCVAALWGLPLAEAHAAPPRHDVHVGTGWQNTGASRSLTWEPAIQGSRKDVPVIAGWSMVGDRRVFWAPFARMKYTNAWSIGGALNLLGVDVGLGGLGVYLTRQPADVERTSGRWFATFTVNVANVRLGANVAPNRPTNDRVPDPDAQRALVREQVATGVPPDHTLQRYPFGSYSYVELAFPIQIRAWKQIRDDLGVGFFFEAVPFGLEWPLDRKVSRFAQTYAVIVGPSIMLGRGGSARASARASAQMSGTPPSR
jgi:ubiquinone biosynthesis protein COQ4